MRYIPIVSCHFILCSSFHGLYHCTHQLSDIPWQQNRYFKDPDTCNLNKLMVVTNVVSCHQDVFALFWDNMFGVNVNVSIHDFHIIYYIMDWYLLTCRTIIISLFLRVQNVYKVVYHWKVISFLSVDLISPVTSSLFALLVVSCSQCVSQWCHRRLWDWEFDGGTWCLLQWQDEYCGSQIANSIRFWSLFSPHQAEAESLNMSSFLFFWMIIFI